jgi:hypothetical protein
MLILKLAVPTLGAGRSCGAEMHLLRAWRFQNRFQSACGVYKFDRQAASAYSCRRPPSRSRRSSLDRGGS